MSRPEDEMLRLVVGTFVGPAKPKQRRRSKPNRCLGCGRVSATIFCRKTYAACQALHQERTGGGQ
jgi:hypothetical protein